MFIFPDTQIEMALMVKGIFKLPLRGLKGLLNSVFMLINIPMKSPTYTCISKRSKSVKVKYRLPNRGAVTHFIIDATVLKVYDDSE
ncbi:transposase [Candidatus Enterovibrio escicola]|uniref:transposase n=1 Tax=Candidatus Enterovibrio escicola TaxID=1927127 RepID=UPI001CC24F25|nr:transposase [Candidatus Enterovibrio escacola]